MVWGLMQDGAQMGNVKLTESDLKNIERALTLLIVATLGECTIAIAEVLHEEDPKLAKKIMEYEPLVYERLVERIEMRESS